MFRREFIIAPAQIVKQIYGLQSNRGGVCQFLLCLLQNYLTQQPKADLIDLIKTMPTKKTAKVAKKAKPKRSASPSRPMLPYGPPIRDAVASGDINHMKAVAEAARRALYPVSFKSVTAAQSDDARKALQELDAAIARLEPK